MHMETNARQRAYVDKKRAEGNGLGLVFADAFIRGMRDIGYKSNGWALAEMLDNAVQANATIIGIQCGFAKGKKSEAKPDMLAVADNGVGMIPEMISYAVRWGGTDRENNREGFGRYGYGLPSSAVSICEKYTVYSKTRDGDWHRVIVDIKELAKHASDVKKTEQMLQAEPGSPPSWISDDLCGIDPSSAESGTIVVLESMDRLEKGWKTTKAFQSKLLQLFGVIYRHWLPSPKIFVHGEVAQPVDPLFLMEGARFFDETEVRAERVETRSIEVETSRGTKGRIKIRAAALPPDFQSKIPGAIGKGVNSRHSIMREYNGLLICRDGRQIDCIQPRHTKFQTYDYNTKIEIDFDPELDEFFGITTSKQQIVLDEVMWDKIEQGGRVRDLVKDIRKRVEDLRAVIKANMEGGDDPETPRPSEEAMAETEKFKSRPSPTSDRQKQEAQKNLDNTAAKIAGATGKPKEEVAKGLEERGAKRRYEVEFQAMPEGPFYRPYRLGEQKRLIINTKHPFYTKVFSVNKEISSALEVLLLVLAEAELECEIDSDPEKFYKSARNGWSERLRNALDRLRSDDEMRDKASAMAEQMHMSAETEDSTEA